MATTTYDEHEQAHDDHDDHHSPRALWMPYGVVLLALWVLTVVTWAVALVDFGHPWSDIVALGIALTKALLVVMFFMHVKGSTVLIKISAISGAFWLLVLFAFTFSDVMTRAINYVSL